MNIAHFCLHLANLVVTGHVWTDTSDCTCLQACELLTSKDALGSTHFPAHGYPVPEVSFMASCCAPRQRSPENTVWHLPAQC